MAQSGPLNLPIRDNPASPPRRIVGLPIFLPLSSNGRTLIKGEPVKVTFSIFLIPCQGRNLGSNPSGGTSMFPDSVVVTQQTLTLLL